MNKKTFFFKNLFSRNLDSLKRGYLDSMQWVMSLSKQGFFTLSSFTSIFRFFDENLNQQKDEYCNEKKKFLNPYVVIFLVCIRSTCMAVFEFIREIFGGVEYWLNHKWKK